MPRVEYAQTPLTGVTHLISVGETPGTDSAGSIFAKSAAVGIGTAAGAALLLSSKRSPWVGLTGFGLALVYFATRR